MLWKGRRESTNVDDRRGVSGGGIAAGGGVIGIIVYLLYTFLGGGGGEEEGWKSALEQLRDFSSLAFWKSRSSQKNSDFRDKTDSSFLLLVLSEDPREL